MLKVQCNSHCPLQINTLLTPHDGETLRCSAPCPNARSLCQCHSAAGADQRGGGTESTLHLGLTSVRPGTGNPAAAPGRPQLHLPVGLLLEQKPRWARVEHTETKGKQTKTTRAKQTPSRVICRREGY